MLRRKKIQHWVLTVISIFLLGSLILCFIRVSAEFW